MFTMSAHGRHGATRALSALRPMVSPSCSLVEQRSLRGPRDAECNVSCKSSLDLRDSNSYDLAWKQEGSRVAAAVACDAGKVVDLVSLGDGSADAAEDEARILDDLLRLGLELSDLEDTFGNTEVQPHAAPVVVDRGYEVRPAAYNEKQAAVGGKAVCPATEGDESDAEELLLDADLQDALLALHAYPNEGDADDAPLKPAAGPFDGAELNVHETSVKPPRAAALATSAVELSDRPSDLVRALLDSDAEDAEDAEDAGDPGGNAALGDTREDIDGTRISPVNALVGEARGRVTPSYGGNSRGHDEGRDARRGKPCPIEGEMASARTSGVPVRVLDAIDLWESANAEREARHARGAGGADACKSKKKNEFGKRRRSSGGGAAVAPCPAIQRATARTNRKAKADPLAALKDARLLSRKPLIVQWLESDGCVVDAEAQAAVGNAVGKLHHIHSHYWGVGG